MRKQKKPEIELLNSCVIRFIQTDLLEITKFHRIMYAHIFKQN